VGLAWHSKAHLAGGGRNSGKKRFELKTRGGGGQCGAMGSPQGGSAFGRDFDQKSSNGGAWHNFLWFVSNQQSTARLDLKL
jgi:hypothetical protein